MWKGALRTVEPDHRVKHASTCLHIVVNFFVEQRVARLEMMFLLQHRTGSLLCRRTQPEQPAGDGEGRVMVFYHVHAINNWREILLDQCTKLIYSGLYEAATAVSAGISGPTQEVPFLTLTLTLTLIVIMLRLLLSSKP